MRKLRKNILWVIICPSELENVENAGSGGGSVGRAVTSDFRDPRFESQQWQNFIYQWYN